MALPKSILFPVDFSDHCHSVWPAVLAMAQDLNAPITMLHAVEVLAAENALPVFGQAEMIHEHLHGTLEHFLAQETRGFNVQRELVDGAAGPAIVSRALNMDAPMIMMPTRGHTRFRQLLLGSVTASVLHDAPCPVWTNAHTELSEPPAGVYRSIVCAVDLGPQTPNVLRAAHEFSTHMQASLHVVHSVPGIDPRFASVPASHAHALLVHRAREDYSSSCAAAGIDVPLEIAEDVGLVAGILRMASVHHANLLVIGRGVIQGTLGRLRTNANELIRRSFCPVLSV